MAKPVCCVMSPIGTRSGYGDHARDICRSLIALDRYDVKLVPTRWGNTPMNALTVGQDDDLISRILGEQLPAPPDLFVQITVPNEFKRIGKYNIGITAGIETTVAPEEWIEGVNQMDLIIVPSEYSKAVLEKTEYEKKDNNTGQLLGKIFSQRPIEVLFEGVDVDLFGCGDYTSEQPQSDVLDQKLADIDTDFNFLFVGHWLKGDFGQDRKNVGRLVSTFYTVFKDYPKERQPGLILKTSQATFSVLDRERIIGALQEIKARFGSDHDNLPPVYFLHGDLSKEEMAALYNHDKVSAHISFTKGEGFGGPLLEATLSGKPVIAPDWGGHIDFLRDRGGIMLDGNLTQVHASAVDPFILENSQWFDVNLTQAAKALIDVYENYDETLKKSQKAFKKNAQDFSFDKMTDGLKVILDKYTKAPEKIKIKLPEMKKRKTTKDKPKLPKIKAPKATESVGA